jgi:hypothetical protein
MKKSGSLNMRMKFFIIILTGLMLISFNTIAYAEWDFGIGTGIFRLNKEGDVGLNTKLYGPIQFEVDMEPDDISDLMETAFGFGGYAKNGKWTVAYSFSFLALEDSPTLTLETGAQIKADISSDTTGGEVTVSHPVYYKAPFLVTLEGGVRVTKHEIETDISLTSGVASGNLSKKIDETWADALFGVSTKIIFSEEWILNNRFNAGFGGSEGTYTGYSGLMWKFHKNWSTTLYGKFTAVEFENEEEGDSDWYLYDVDEFGWGLSFLFHW